MGAQPQQFGVVEAHPDILGQLQSCVQAVAGLLGLAGGDQQPPEDGVIEGDIGVHFQRAPGVEKRGQGCDVRCKPARVVVGVECGQGAEGGMLGGPHQLKKVETVPLGQTETVGGGHCGAVELAGFDADPALEETRVGVP